MTMSKLTGNLIKALILLAGIYAFVQWGPIGMQADDVTEFAEKACQDEVNARYNVSTVRVYNVSETNNGYVVRITVTSAGGSPAKVVCLTNAQGGVRDISIDER